MKFLGCNGAFYNTNVRWKMAIERAGEGIGIKFLRCGKMGDLCQRVNPCIGTPGSINMMMLSPARCNRLLKEELNGGEVSLPLPTLVRCAVISDGEFVSNAVHHFIMQKILCFTNVANIER